jgi:hypothetical protein
MRIGSLFLVTSIVLCAGCGTFGGGSDDPPGEKPSSAPTGTFTASIRHEQPKGSSTEKNFTARFQGEFVQGDSSQGKTTFDLSEAGKYTPPGDALLTTQAKGLRSGRWKITVKSSLSGIVTCDGVTVPNVSLNVVFDRNGTLKTPGCH